jgi:oligosaccharide reducing-end xylanase
MPAYYDLWAQATGDPFWNRAAEAARAYLHKTAYPTTGLMPVRATFAGEMVAGWNAFQPEAYRAQINMALDKIWSEARQQDADDWNGKEADLLLAFFSKAGIDNYGTSYTLDGTLLNPMRENALVAVNGITGLIANGTIERSDYIDRVWGMQIPNGTPRYYQGIMYLTALLILSGQYIIL